MSKGGGDSSRQPYPSTSPRLRQLLYAISVATVRLRALLAAASQETNLRYGWTPHQLPHTGGYSTESPPVGGYTDRRRLL